MEPGTDLHRGGLGALHDAVQQTYHVLRQALGQHHQGQGLLGPLGPPIDYAAQGGLLGDGRGQVDPRMLDYGSGGAQTPVRPQEPNPFWSPALQDTMRRAASGVGGDLSGGDDSRRLHGPGSETGPRAVAGGNSMSGAAVGSPTRDDVEALRARILKEAEENFDREVKRLLAAKEPADTNSYKTASSGPQGGMDAENYAGPERPPGLPSGDLGGKDRGPELGSRCSYAIGNVRSPEESRASSVALAQLRRSIYWRLADNELSIDGGQLEQRQGLVGGITVNCAGPLCSLVDDESLGASESQAGGGGGTCPTAD